MKEKLLICLNKYAQFTEPEVDEVYNHMVLKKFNKKEFLLQEGEICKYQFFILEGLYRSFYVDDKGNDHILHFAIENWWITSVESFVKQTPSAYAIQALEDSIVLMITKEDIEKLYIKIPKLERVFRIIWENMLIALQRRYGFYMKMSSKDRFDNLVMSLPDFVQRVPQYMIASYLEVTPEYLSELRKKK